SFSLVTFAFRICWFLFVFFFSSRRRHTRFDCDWSSDVCSSDLSQNRLSAPFSRVISANFRNYLQCLKDCLLTGRELKGDQRWRGWPLPPNQAVKVCESGLNSCTPWRPFSSSFWL